MSFYYAALKVQVIRNLTPYAPVKRTCYVQTQAHTDSIEV